MNKKIPFIPAVGIIALLALLVGTVVVLGSLALRGKSVSLYSFETPMPKPEISETADWQTYINEEYKYEVGYPKGWLVVEMVGKEWISITSEDNATGFGGPLIFRHGAERERIDIRIEDLTPEERKSFEEVWEAAEVKKEIRIGMKDYQGKKYQIKQTPTQDGFADFTARVIFIYHGSFIYIFVTDIEDPAILVIEEILSTFRFID